MHRAYILKPSDVERIGLPTLHTVKNTLNPIYEQGPTSMKFIHAQRAMSTLTTCASREEAGDAGYHMRQDNAETPGMLMLLEIGITRRRKWYKLAQFTASQYR